MIIIDTHTHIFPDTDAERILKSTSQQFKVKVYGKGTASDLIAQMDENNVFHAVIHMVALHPQRVKEINTWLISLREPRFIKFGTVLPFQLDYQREISRLSDNGITGIKLQPEVQGFRVDDADLTYPLYEALLKNNMTVMFHAGGNPAPSVHQRSAPHMLLRVAQDFPDLAIIAAHLGGLNMWNEAAQKLAGRENVYLETSMTYGRITAPVAETIIRKHDLNRIFFGTDYPFAPIKNCIQSALNTPFLNQEEKKALMGLNARAFFKLSANPQSLRGIPEA
jgi:predicted TIM-barrel fold metal-dependent hydrolase